MSDDTLLDQARDLAVQYLESLPERPVRARATRAELLSALGGPLAEQGEDAGVVLRGLATSADPGLIASAGGRYFGFVTGGALPVTLASEWLVSAWDQCAALYALSPAASVIEEIASAWLLEILGLPRGSSVGFVTGGLMANFSGLAVARHAVLARTGYDVEGEGLQRVPKISIVVGAEAHVTIFMGLRYLGLGEKSAVRVEADGQGRMIPSRLREALAQCSGPTIVCAQAGNVNTGAFDPLDEIADLCREKGAWLHVDGAFGLWAGASREFRHLLRGVEKADSWSTDVHKYLNCPYDSGLVIVSDPAAHRATLTARACYLVLSEGPERDNSSYAPEASRRARGVAVYAALRHLGKRGVEDLVNRCARHARRMADILRASPGVQILNDVVLNQVLVRFEARGRDADEVTRSVIARVQEAGVCWLGGTRWHEMDAMRVSVSNWRTEESDIERSAASILEAARSEGVGRE